MSIKMKELPISERPYEKLQMYGAKNLSNSELLAIIIKNGTRNESSITLAQKILNLKGQDNDLKFLQDVSIEEFMTIKGIGKVKAIQLKAVSELTKRMGNPIDIQNIIIRSSSDIAKIVMEELRYEKREIAKVVLLNSKNIIIKMLDVSFGGVNFASLEPKEVLSEAIKINAPNIILIHNHPSGDPSPSENDYIITNRIVECSNIMGITLLDHIIIGDGIFKSILSKR